MFWKLCLVVCLAVACEPTDDRAAGEQSKRDDPVVAVMDSKEIRQSDIEPDEEAVSNVRPDDRGKTLKRWRASNLHGFILGPLIREYAKERKIEATDAEIDSFNEHMDKAMRRAAEENPDLGLSEADSDDPEAKAAEREIGRMMVETWKVSKELYDQYGGDVIFQQGNPTEPVGAYRKLLEEAEEQGASRSWIRRFVKTSGRTSALKT